ncbi:hypothetical protein D3C79_1028530 [compost metagenome]
MGMTMASNQISVPSLGIRYFNENGFFAASACPAAMATLPFHDIATQVLPLARSLIFRSLSK